MNNYTRLLQNIKRKKASIAVIGLGYVGLPLAISLAKKGYTVHGFGKTPKNMKALSMGVTNMPEYEEDLKSVLKSRKLTVQTISQKGLQENDIYIICVPTPVNKNKKPNLESLKNVAKYLSRLNLQGKLVINESTVAPYTTRNLFSKLHDEFFLVCSPERIDPGTAKSVESIPKVIGAIDKESLELGVALYEQILEKKLIIVSSMEAAELTKMLENTYRAVNIALVNEFAKLADEINIDILDVINAANSKWSFAAHYPGIGVGGHCIPVDPYYVLQLAKKKNVAMDVTKTSLEQNESMPRYMFEKLLEYYKKGMEILVYGVTYKKNVADLRESPVLIFIKLLEKKKIPFTVYDPLISKRELKKLGVPSGILKPVDILVVGSDHNELAQDYHTLISDDTIVIDGRNYFTKPVGKKVIGVGRTLQ